MSSPSSLFRTRQLALALTLIVPVFAQASTTTVRNLLWEAQTAYRSQAMIHTHDPAFAELASGQSQTFRATVTPNTTYLIHADCSSPCADVDLYVYDVQGNLITSDTRISRAAALRIDTNSATELRYGIRMANCSGANCTAGAFLMAEPPKRTANTSPELTTGEAVGAVVVTGLVLGALCALTDCLEQTNSARQRCRTEDVYNSDGRGGMRVIGQRQVCN